jgi:uncharacterized protein YcnI
LPASEVPARAARIAGLALLALALGAAAAQAHAIVSPSLAPSGELEQFTLSVPTEKDGTTTTKVQLTVPAGFAIDSFEASPGWKRQLVAKGSGENAVVQRVAWSGGRVPTGEDAVFRFNAEATKDATYTFTVRQTYADGSVVDWSGPESSDTPAPTLEAKSSLGSGGGQTLALVALIVAAIAVLLSIVGLAAGRRPLT